MSQLKKALQQLFNEQEFYAQAFLSHPLYQQWQQSVSAYYAEEFATLIDTEVHNEERLTWLLKKQPALVKMILDREILSQIKPWYQQHPSADFKRQRRQHTALVDTLYILCARYKKQLRSLILKASNGFIGVSLEEPALSETKIRTPSLNLTASQNQQLKRALKYYQVAVKLEQSLTGDDSAQQKLYAFMNTFYAPDTQAALHQHPPSSVMKLFKKLLALLQFEQWLTSVKPRNDESLSYDQNLLTELTREVKKIVL